MNLKKIFLLGGLLFSLSGMYAQSMVWISSTEGNVWKEAKVKLQAKCEEAPLLKTDGTDCIQTFQKWGTCFNELGWDALNMLPLEGQEEVLNRIFAPDGELKFTMGRIPMNANDYARDWYSCDGRGRC